MSSNADLGDVTSPFDNIHPRDKQDVGYRSISILKRRLVKKEYRLALCGLGITYGQNVQYLGPMFKGMKVVRGPPNVILEIDFDSASIGSGLQLRNTQCPSGVPPNLCVGVEIGTSDGSWTTALESISNGKYYAAATISSTLKPTGILFSSVLFSPLLFFSSLHFLFSSSGCSSYSFVVCNRSEIWIFNMATLQCLQQEWIASSPLLLHSLIVSIFCPL